VAGVTTPDRGPTWASGDPSCKPEPPTILNDIKRLWRGEVGLFAAFWGWLLLGGILVNGMTTALNLVLVTRDLPVAGLVIGYAISVPYTLLAMIGVWRASETHPGDPGVARGMRWLGVIIAVVLCVT